LTQDPSPTIKIAAYISGDLIPVIIIEANVASQGHIYNFLLNETMERKYSRQHKIQNYSKTEIVDGLVEVIQQKNFRGDVAKCSRIFLSRVHIFQGLLKYCEAKIDNFDSFYHSLFWIEFDLPLIVVCTIMFSALRSLWIRLSEFI
jgi:hypothetical protein